MSASELLAETLKRIDRVNPRVNAIVLQFREQALDRARGADEVLARGDVWGPLHGIPVTIKESFAYQGTPSTWGDRALKHALSTRTAPAVERLEAAGAIIVGKTNVPLMLTDWQSYNDLYGCTNNPWDLSRTAGGSSGGESAAIASGMSWLGLGSDIGGSVRFPAHCCGIYGHKPTLGAVSLDGHVPGAWSGLLEPFAELPVAGPMARSAGDLALAMTLLSERPLPPPRHLRLRDYRVGYVGMDDNVLDFLRSGGVKLTEGWPQGVDPQAQFGTYRRLLDLYLRAVMGDTKGPSDDHAAWFRDMREASRLRTAWQEYFRTHDAFLMPVSFTAAFPHDHSARDCRTLGRTGRVIQTPHGDRAYDDLVYWFSCASVTGLPSTVAPVGKTDGGLPVGIQILAPMWEDLTATQLADLMVPLAQAVGAPPEEW